MTEGIDWTELNRRHANGDVDYQIVQTLREGTKHTLGPNAARALSHPLDRYRHNKTITQRQYDAGFKLYYDYTKAQIRSSYSSLDGSPAPTTYFSRSVTDRQLDAHTAYTQALLGVGPRLSITLTDIVLHEMTLEQHAGRLECSTRTAKRRLKLALNNLAAYYRLAE